jgi:hypothetical protein
MIEAIAAPIGQDSLINIGTAVVVVTCTVGIAIQAALLKRDVQDLKRGMLHRRDFEVWTLRLARDNPSGIKVPEFKADSSDD